MKLEVANQTTLFAQIATLNAFLKTLPINTFLSMGLIT